MSTREQHTTNWPDLAAGLFDCLTGRQAEISYKFEDMHLRVPSGVGEEAKHAEWVLNGGLKVSTREGVTSPN